MTKFLQVKNNIIYKNKKINQKKDYILAQTLLVKLVQIELSYFSEWRSSIFSYKQQLLRLSLLLVRVRTYVQNPPILEVSRSVIFRQQWILDIIVFQISQYIISHQMNSVLEQEPFAIVKNYRKMIARRDRHHKKRRPKNYPPTSIKTRSMEQKQTNPLLQQMRELEHYSQILPLSSSWHQTQSPELLLLTQNQRQIENSISIQALSMGEEEKPTDQKDSFFFWQNEINHDLNDQELLPIS